MNLRKKLPFLRWSFIRLGLGMRHLLKDWQVGDGREEDCALYVLAHARPGDINDAIRAIDDYAYNKKVLINIGDEKGEILDAALTRAKAHVVLELGTYVGYSALRIARKLPPTGHLYSVEFNPANASIARRILAHAGAASKVTVVTGHLGDGGATMDRLKLAIKPGTLDLVFLDHAKDAYVPDLELILKAGLLHANSIVVADNVRFPGAPAYQAYMAAEEGKRWLTTAHHAHAEYQTFIKDTVLESSLIG